MISQSNWSIGRPLGFVIDRLNTSASLYRITPCLNVSELNYTRVDTWKKLEETRRVYVHVRLLSQDSLLIYFNFFPKFFSKILSCQTWGAAYLRVWLIHQCLQYIKNVKKNRGHRTRFEAKAHHRP